MKSNKKTLINVLILFLVLIPVIGYKIFTIVNYSIPDNEKENVTEIKKTVENIKNVHLTHKDYSGKYLTYKGINVAKITSNLTMMSTNKNSNTYKNQSNDIYLTLGTEDKEIEKFKKINNDCHFCKSTIDKIINTNNLESSSDVLNYIKEYQFSYNSSIITSASKIKEDYIVGTYLLSNFDNIYEIMFIEGKYQGYLYSTNSKSNPDYHEYKVVIEENDTNYFIEVRTTDDSVKLEDMYDLISTMKIE